MTQLLPEIRACTYCQEEGIIPEARPILQWGRGAKIAVFGQAPGNLAHQSGKAFSDPSGVRLRNWMGVSEAEFYDPKKLAIIPMSFCFPGYDGKGPTGKGGDLPPPKICAIKWRAQIMEQLLPQLELILLIGKYAQDWHLPEHKKLPLTARVEDWQSQVAAAKAGAPVYLPMPHPSWRNNGWLKKHPWFEGELLAWLRPHVRDLLG